MSISKLVLACSLALAALTLAASAQAEVKKPVKHKSAKPAKAAEAKSESKEANEEADEPAIAGSAVTDFHCELGNKVTIFKNLDDDNHIALRWKKRLHRLTRVGTETGALRFENKLYGLIWIGIPAKGMLLDSKLNRQLANECRNAEQLAPVGAAPAAPADAKL
ncbi:hypothetical protein ACFOLJ_18275 [Rugamonas sp. CCM 8940]|uniref:hypothetical protein n=1 Tax=Rugamonas sp. CCM 8940 TaxID=2765359 RepID=UPI0018F5CAA5|nr:hypothetical protein [Rugamonas sp. CCM 8940]MBJ7310966.1 hypothetical protein [Rugamonas sp. CCM 8940]